MKIRFRVWDKDKKRLIYSGCDDFVFLVFQRNGKVGVEGCHNLGGDPDEEIENFELMQFTGMTDKNGKEIYEGDKVEELNDSGSVVDSFTVKLKEGGFYPFAIPAWECTPETKNCVIVGNIYENPDKK
jgi:uncharacterized phage protein (TIGR01671 family)